ncbi:hypothetical protein PAPYR_5845 [Paratrimastix pyriformis]|uniref:Uncharacterized protein n=1 Tax=Paratrimastix pyriformis TaxID=342808 RepID=A0ABQ8UJ67_9EUKA|nr:hypothetical protein PAPYR_5845 [Paratrimastix pyriformis]
MSPRLAQFTREVESMITTFNKDLLARRLPLLTPPPRPATIAGIFAVHCYLRSGLPQQPDLGDVTFFQVKLNLFLRHGSSPSPISEEFREALRTFSRIARSPRFAAVFARVLAEIAGPGPKPFDEAYLQAVKVVEQASPAPLNGPVKHEYDGNEDSDVTDYVLAEYCRPHGIVLVAEGICHTKNSLLRGKARTLTIVKTLIHERPRNLRPRPRPRCHRRCHRNRNRTHIPRNRIPRNRIPRNRIPRNRIPATGSPATASPATASPATASPATASPATASPATASPATASPAAATATPTSVPVPVPVPATAATVIATPAAAPPPPWSAEEFALAQLAASTIPSIPILPSSSHFGAALVEWLFGHHLPRPTPDLVFDVPNFFRAGDALCDQFVDALIRGDVISIRELAERLPGRPSHTNAITHNDDGVYSLARRLVLRY